MGGYQALEKEWLDPGPLSGSTPPSVDPEIFPDDPWIPLCQVVEKVRH